MIRGPQVGLLGGTFDPIHLGHLAVARAAQHTLRLETIRFLPAAQPPHRPDSPHASEYHRVEMARLAVAGRDQPGTRWEVSGLELDRDGPSYTFDTLRSIHAEGLTPQQIVFLTGADAFAEIETWYRYPEVLDCAHFGVVTRPGTTLESLRQRLPTLAPRMIEAPDVIRTSSPRIILIPADTPDISSTDIRRLAARGGSIAEFVPAAVAAYIEQHSLYRTAPVTPDSPGAPKTPAPKASAPKAPSAQ
jgi:nicotinate-nucleotide adenylyltransferase